MQHVTHRFNNRFAFVLALAAGLVLLTIDYISVSALALSWASLTTLFILGMTPPCLGSKGLCPAYLFYHIVFGPCFLFFFGPRSIYTFSLLSHHGLSLSISLSISLRHQQFPIPPEVLPPFLELERLSTACIPLPSYRHGTLPARWRQPSAN